MRKTVLFYAVMTLVAALLAAAAGVPSLFTPPASLERGVVSTLAAVALSLAVVYSGRVLERVSWYRDMAAWLGRLVRILVGPRFDALDAALLALSSAVGEEALFRGLLQPWLGGLVAVRFLDRPDLAPALGVLIAGVLFGVLHAPIVRELRPWTFFAVAIGLAFGALAAWSGSLLAPVIAHFLINFLNMKRLLELPDPGPVPSDRAALRDGKAP